MPAGMPAAAAGRVAAILAGLGRQDQPGVQAQARRRRIAACIPTRRTSSGTGRSRPSSESTLCPGAATATTCASLSIACSGRCAGIGDLNRFLLVDQHYYLPDDILYKCDRMSMAHSLEVRPPFLDHRIVEFAASLPAEFQDPRRHDRSSCSKQLMQRQAPGHRHPDRKKTGFDIPAHDWFRGMLRDLLLDTLSPEAVAATGIFDCAAQFRT